MAQTHPVEESHEPGGRSPGGGDGAERPLRCPGIELSSVAWPRHSLYVHVPASSTSVVERRNALAEPEPFRDVHIVVSGIERRPAQLASDSPVGDGLEPTREPRDAILGFVCARRVEVGDLRLRTYLAWLPSAAVRLGPSLLLPDRDAQSAFNQAFPRSEYSRASREGAAR